MYNKLNWLSNFEIKHIGLFVALLLVLRIFYIFQTISIGNIQNAYVYIKDLLSFTYFIMPHVQFIWFYKKKEIRESTEGYSRGQSGKITTNSGKIRLSPMTKNNPTLTEKRVM